MGEQRFCTENKVILIGTRLFKFEMLIAIFMAATMKITQEIYKKKSKGLKMVYK